MRKLILIVLVANCFSMFGQDYKPLLDNYNEWNLTYCFNNICTTDYYYTNGDTIVDGMNYKVLDGYHYISRGFLLREDVAQKKVYIKTILPNITTDHLLYNFSLEVGDSIDIKNPYTPFPTDAGYYKVDSIIPRPLVDGNNYKHFYLSPTISNTTSVNSAIWVEGVGSLSLINAPGGNPITNGVGRVACMFKNGISFYSDLDIIDECEPYFILDTPSYTNEVSTIKAIATPTTNVFEIINMEDITAIVLYDLKGVKLDTFTSNNQNSIYLNLKKYQSGMYLLILKSNNNRYQSLKVIVK
ncbi:MAG: hypothetical protein ACI9M9_002402 [Flavobacteriaceae bacterium]|jgi:hypothetical protein